MTTHRRRNRPTTDNAASDRKSTRLNSSHLVISYAVFCLKKKKQAETTPPLPSRPSPPHCRRCVQLVAARATARASGPHSPGRCPDTSHVLNVVPLVQTWS